MRYDYIIICTYGRSGSTLLQGVLNSCDNVLIRGENHDFIYSLYASFLKLKKTKEHIKQKDLDTSTNAWYGASGISLNRYLLDLNTLVKNVLLGDLQLTNNYTIGFKEIRYAYLQTQDLNDYLKFLNALFPNCAIIFNLRNIEDTLKSGWWVDENPEESRGILSRFQRFATQYTQEKQNAFIINYEDVITKNENFFNLFSFLGMKYKIKKIDEVLKISHSYGNKSKLPKNNKIKDVHPLLNNRQSIFKMAKKMIKNSVSFVSKLYTVLKK